MSFVRFQNKILNLIRYRLRQVIFKDFISIDWIPTTVLIFWACDNQLCCLSDTGASRLNTSYDADAVRGLFISQFERSVLSFQLTDLMLGFNGSRTCAQPVPKQYILTLKIRTKIRLEQHINSKTRQCAGSWNIKQCATQILSVLSVLGNKSKVGSALWHEPTANFSFLISFCFNHWCRTNYSQPESGQHHQQTSVCFLTV